jgi:Predicted Rossmann fold nucleotide-binding protein
MKKTIIGIMGPGESATSTDLENAYQLGQLIAEAGWILLTGGRNVGVMDAANKGAKSANGLTVGILPGK